MIDLPFRQQFKHGCKKCSRPLVQSLEIGHHQKKLCGYVNCHQVSCPPEHAGPGRSSPPMSLGLPPRAGSPVDPEIRGFWQRPQQREDLHSFRTPTRPSSIHPVNVHATSRDGSPLNLIILIRGVERSPETARWEPEPPRNASGRGLRASESLGSRRWAIP
jgi:hypothetical protein